MRGVLELLQTLILSPASTPAPPLAPGSLVNTSLLLNAARPGRQGRLGLGLTCTPGQLVPWREAGPSTPGPLRRGSERPPRPGAGLCPVPLERQTEPCSTLKIIFVVVKHT